MPTINFELSGPGLSSEDALEFYGPTLNVEISRDSGAQPAAGSMRTQSRIRYPALIDTGSKAELHRFHTCGRTGPSCCCRYAAAGCWDSWALALLDVYLAEISIPELGVVGGRSFLRRSP